MFRLKSGSRKISEIGGIFFDGRKNLVVENIRNAKYDAIITDDYIGVLGDPKITKKDLLGKHSTDLIRQGMVESCSTGGVAWPLFNFQVKNSKLRVDGKNFLEAPQSTTSAGFKDFRRVSIACKTGTAQHGDETTLPHAWITLFVPAEKPEIIVTVLSEASGEGSNIAAPIAKKILEEWFSR
ncbi:MAG: Penicillin-binding protein 2 [Candidatus Levybacteria bacterium GW2011_GWC2_40_7]|nr:MAG: Penicillin-binding protein 2 [Candidatus Levybacteria bacterium GW2011_GWC2_40_7]